MKTFYWESKSCRESGYVSAETAGKAKYIIWLRGACDYFESFGKFVNDIKIRVVRT